MASDLELLDAWKAGDRTAGAELFDRHFAALSRFFRNKASAHAEDLIQDTLVGCIDARDRFRGEASFRTYLFAIARNVLRNHYRRLAADRVDPDFGVTSIAELDPTPSVALVERREHRVLLEALRRIPVDHQVLLELYYWEHLRAADIAAILEVPEGTVRTRIRRAKQLLADRISVLAGAPVGLESTLMTLDAWAAQVRERLGGG